MPSTSSPNRPSPSRSSRRRAPNEQKGSREKVSTDPHTDGRTTFSVRGWISKIFKVQDPESFRLLEISDFLDRAMLSVGDRPWKPIHVSVIVQSPVPNCNSTVESGNSIQPTVVHWQSEERALEHLRERRWSTLACVMLAVENLRGSAKFEESIYNVEIRAQNV